MLASRGRRGRAWLSKSSPFPASTFVHSDPGGVSESARWTLGAGDALEVNADLRGQADTHLWDLWIRRSFDTLSVTLGSSASSDDVRDLSDLFESDGSIEVQVSGQTLLVIAAGRDTEEPYIYTFNALLDTWLLDILPGSDDLSGTLAATVIVRDYIPAAPHFVDDTGDTIAAERDGDAIPDVVVPEAAAVGRNSLQIPLPAARYFRLNNRGWRYTADRPVIGNTFAPSTQYFAELSKTVGTQRMTLSFAGGQSSDDTDGRELGGNFEVAGTVQIDVGSMSVLVRMAGMDIEEPYTFIPSNGAEFETFMNAVDSLTNRTGTLTLRDYDPEAGPNPTPTYAVVGALPTGVSFDPDTRALSFDENLIEVGTGTITIRAANDDGMDDWNVDYEFTLARAAPEFTDDTGDAISGVIGLAIANIVVPSAGGIPAATYAAVGDLPSGVTFDPGTRTLSFDETAITAGSGTIRIRATNSEGSDDWTVEYAFAETASLFDGPVHNPGDDGDIGNRWSYPFTAFPTTENATRAHLIANNQIAGGVTPETFEDQGGTAKRIDWFVLHHGRDVVILNLDSSVTNATEEDYHVAFRDRATGTVWDYAVSTGGEFDPYEMPATQDDLDALAAVISGGGTLDAIIYDEDVANDLPGWDGATLMYGGGGTPDLGVGAALAQGVEGVSAGVDKTVPQAARVGSQAGAGIEGLTAGLDKAEPETKPVGATAGSKANGLQGGLDKGSEREFIGGAFGSNRTGIQSGLDKQSPAQKPAGASAGSGQSAAQAGPEKREADRKVASANLAGPDSGLQAGLDKEVRERKPVGATIGTHRDGVSSGAAVAPPGDDEPVGSSAGTQRTGLQAGVEKTTVEDKPVGGATADSGREGVQAGPDKSEANQLPIGGSVDGGLDSAQGGLVKGTPSGKAVGATYGTHRSSAQAGLIKEDLLIEPPPNIRILQPGHRTAFLAWDAPDSRGGPITGYDVRIDNGPWLPIGTSDTRHLVGNLQPGTSYRFSVRARSALGTGEPSSIFVFNTLEITNPGVPRFQTSVPTGQTGIDLAWFAPESDGGSAIIHYEVCVIDPDGTLQPYEATDGPVLTHRVRGLAIGHRYGFRIRAVNEVGPGPATKIIYDLPVRYPVLIIRPGQQIPLLDADRQSLIVRLGDQDCRIRIWWQPSDESWWGSLEVPVNTPAVQSVRLALNSGILDRIDDVLPGNIVMRGFGDFIGTEPGRNAWQQSTHALVWEPNQES